MSQKLRLFSLASGAYPPRVLIYMQEKGITSDDVAIVEVGMSAQGIDVAQAGRENPADEQLAKCGRTVPLLEITEVDGSRRYVYQSMGIIEYLEAQFNALPSLRGTSAFQRARVVDLLSVIEETTTYFALYASHSSQARAATGEQDANTAKHALRKLKRSLHQLEDLTDMQGPFLAGSSVTIADCVAYALVQFAYNAYSLNKFLAGLRKLEGWYGRFQDRDSVKVVARMPEDFRAVMGQYTVGWDEVS